jgi:hypothetical protein
VKQPQERAEQEPALKQLDELSITERGWQVGVAAGERAVLPLPAFAALASPQLPPLQAQPAKEQKSQVDLTHVQ